MLFYVVLVIKWIDEMFAGTMTIALETQFIRLQMQPKKE